LASIFPRRSLLYMRHLARVSAGKDACTPRKVAADYVVLGSGLCQWPLLPEITSDCSVVYSFGVGEDITFDLAVIERFGCQVYAFDPTPKSVKWIRSQSTPPEFNFFDYGISAKPGEMLFYPPKTDEHVSYTVSDRTRSDGGTPVKCQVLDLNSIMERLDHKAIDILKMDVEGAEYDVIETLEQQSAAPAQLMVEFHHGMYGWTAKDTNNALATLTRIGYAPYYVSDTWREFGFVHRDSMVERRLA
jgi:FkbM family methyltransferase